MLLQVLQSFYFALGGFASATLASLLGAVLAPFGRGALVIALEVLAVVAGTVGVGVARARLDSPHARDEHRRPGHQRARGQRARACPVTISR